MEKYFSHKAIRRQLEFLNFAIGFTLVGIGVVYIHKGQMDYFASWFIFGCMYMVMDAYWPSEKYSRFRKAIDIAKYGINITALLVSLWFFMYLLG